jgi:hypothetical protein
MRSFARLTEKWADGRKDGASGDWRSGGACGGEGGMISEGIGQSVVIVCVLLLRLFVVT